MKSALILYPHQLFAVEKLPAVETILLVEDPFYFGIDRDLPLKLHKQKLILHRASMRRYVEEVLWPAGYEVDYIELDAVMTSEDIFERTKKFQSLCIFDPIDDVLTKRLLEVRRSRSDIPAFEFLPHPNFYLKNQEIQGFFGDKHTSTFADFYQWQRERFNILIDDNYKPVGGKWMFENAKPTKVPKDQQLPSFEVYGNNKYVEEAIQYVNKHFPENPGGTDFIWPTNHAEAAKWLEDFVDGRLDLYGTHYDALDGQAAWLFHSALSVSLNIGLISPHQVVEAALARHAKRPAPIESLEMFIREIVGWREFMRGLYLTQSTSMRNSNPFKHQRRMTAAWYDGGVGLPPFDDVLKKLLNHAYVHDAERTMIAGNLMLISEIHPADMRRWFAELCVDSYDWIMLPHIYLLNEFAAENMFAGKTAIAASNYILQMSHYERDVWADTWDGLFWQFVEKHRDMLKKNPRTRVLVQRLDRLDGDRKRIIGYRANDFLNNLTQ